MFGKKGVLRNFTKFIGKDLSLFFNKVAGLKRLWHRYFPMNFVKVLRTSFLQNISGRLLLSLLASRSNIFDIRCLCGSIFVSFERAFVSEVFVDCFNIKYTWKITWKNVFGAHFLGAPNHSSGTKTNLNTSLTTLILDLFSKMIKPKLKTKNR